MLSPPSTITVPAKRIEGVTINVMAFAVPLALAAVTLTAINGATATAQLAVTPAVAQYPYGSRVTAGVGGSLLLMQAVWSFWTKRPFAGRCGIPLAERETPSPLLDPLGQKPPANIARKRRSSPMKKVRTCWSTSSASEFTHVSARSCPRWPAPTPHGGCWANCGPTVFSVNTSIHASITVAYLWGRLPRQSGSRPSFFARNPEWFPSPSPSPGTARSDTREPCRNAGPAAMPEEWRWASRSNRAPAPPCCGILEVAATSHVPLRYLRGPGDFVRMIPASP